MITSLFMEERQKEAVKYLSLVILTKARENSAQG